MAEKQIIGYSGIWSDDETDKQVIGYDGIRTMSAAEEEPQEYEPQTIV